ncbi:MAG: Amidohydrolase 3 [Actinotalea sp.]|nr:Amidohydrolase 3 [Actinotalea sp.]
MAISGESTLLFVNGVVRTLDGPGTIAEAVAVRGDRIVGVGSTHDILAARGSGTEVIDLAGRVVIPALTDSHTHFRGSAITNVCLLDFSVDPPRDVADVLRIVADRVRETAEGSWVRGANLVIDNLAERRMPHRYELDAVAPNVALALYGMGNHVVGANSRALQLAGIDRHRADPAGGRIERDAHGDPTGVLHERAKLGLDPTIPDSAVPPIAKEERLRAIAEYSDALLAHGIAGIHEIVRAPEEIADYATLREQGRQKVRTRLYVRGIESTTKLEYVTGLGMRSEFGDEWLKIGGVKFSIDGLETAGNAAVRAGSYKGDPANEGIIRIGEPELREALQAAEDHGLQAAVHAIGPAAVDIALNCFEALVPAREGGRRLLHRIEHSYMPMLRSQWDRMAKLGLLWSTQPSFMYQSGETWLELLSEEAQVGPWLPLRTGADLGIPFMLNSDHACSPINPFLGVQTAVSRQTAGGTKIDGAEAITVDAALRAMTNTPALDSRGHRGPRGSIEPGKLADLAVLGVDPYHVEPHEIAGVEVDLTVVDGKIAYARE